MIKKSRILIVDDNVENLSVLGNMLMNSSYTVQVAQNGESAIKTVHKKHPDLVLLDINMPGLSGYDVCRNIKENKDTADIPVIFLTAHSEIEHIVEGFSLGAVDYVTKPFNEEELLSRVRTHLELKKAKSELEQKNDELQEVLATKDKLFSIIAHDLKGPIASMMALIDLVVEEENINKEEMYQILRSQQELTRSTYNLLDNLLNWARQSMDQIYFYPVLLKINKLLNENLTSLSFLAKQKKISVNGEFTDEIIVYADKDMVNLILRNLLTNAIKFTPTKGCIEVYPEEKTNEIEIVISDNGVGISKENIQKILSDSEFHTSAGTNSEKGTGLGLKLVRNFVEINRGKLKIESELNKGTRISFTLPKTP